MSTATIIKTWEDLEQLAESAPYVEPMTLDESYTATDDVSVGVEDASADTTAKPQSQQSADVPTFSIKLTTAAELDEEVIETRFLIENYFAAFQSEVFAGPMKACKTSMVLNKAFAMATGSQFLGRFNVSMRVKTLVLTGESGRSTIQETLRRIARSYEMSLRDAGDWLVITEEIPRLNDPAHLAAISEVIDEHKFEALFLDPAYFAIDGTDAGNLFSMGDQLRPMAQLCSQRGVTLSLVHHTKRSSDNAREYAPLELEDIAWAGFAEFARQWTLISRREKYEPGSGLHRLWFSYGGSAGHSGLLGVDIDEGPAGEPRKWDVTANDAEDARQSSKAESAARREQLVEDRAKKALEKSVQSIKSAFLLNEVPMTKSDLLARAGINNSNGQKAIGYMLRIGELVQTEVKKSNGQTYAGFMIKV